MKKTLKTYIEGRKCAFTDCNRILSIYNHEQYCFSHQYEMSEESKIRALIHVKTSTG